MLLFDLIWFSDENVSFHWFDSSQISIWYRLQCSNISISSYYSMWSKLWMRISKWRPLQGSTPQYVIIIRSDHMRMFHFIDLTILKFQNGLSCVVEKSQEVVIIQYGGWECLMWLIWQFSNSKIKSVIVFKNLSKLL